MPLGVYVMPPGGGVMPPGGGVIPLGVSIMPLGAGVMPLGVDVMGPVFLWDEDDEVRTRSHSKTPSLSSRGETPRS
jgi:hypothetical protein